ncbi:MAG: hypothetical protein GC161_17630 [Planctomycetaceae bacterium]|nr:hypothetical protein [Planctomycetaceae bacterium]
MALKPSKIATKLLCQGSEWNVSDEDALAHQVARIALGQYRHVAKILLGSGSTDEAITLEARQSAIELLTLRDNEKQWHRDGWLFQAISWIAASQVNGVAIRAPHLIKAHKGFDGLQLRLSSRGAVTAVIIFEDKATSNPRRTLKKDVWPDIQKLEQGERTNELCQEVSALLEAQVRTFPSLDVDAAVSRIAWEQRRRYRVAVTVATPHKTARSRRRLFKDYDKVVTGQPKRRGAETLYLPELRPWMQQFAAQVISKLNALPTRV